MKLRQLVNNKILLASVALTSSSAFADGNATNTAITAAIESGKSMVATTTAGVIAIAALGFGLGMVVSWLRK
ncbi:Phage coat protein [Vibrio crassostreae]|nr:Phage coat protein [Vibrio crassostreae]CAK3829829.1 Phage coat protein [Vibrio crassostreae]CAK3895030.1 Phage coat protein [Vibrio crassostreae]